MERYRVGFEDGVSCPLRDKIDLIPVVDTEGVFAFGEAIAFCLSESGAKSVADAMNLMEHARKKLNK